MAEENDKTGRDEALNEDASTPETADDATDETPVDRKSTRLNSSHAR